MPTTKTPDTRTQGIFVVFVVQFLMPDNLWEGHMCGKPTPKATAMQDETCVFRK